ncbi:MAG: RNA polymerase sigma factor [Phycisphaerales bacterium]|nr:RNA polymerase sigma factor [Phycisphaerales bacterium]
MAKPSNTARRSTNARAPSAGSEATDAVARLVDLYGPRLHGLARKLCSRRSDADDLVQDVFLQAFRKWHTFRGESDPGTWLYTIAARACRARSRRARARSTVSLGDVSPWRETTVTRMAAADHHPSAAERNEAIDRVQHAIARLPEHLRLPLVLKEVLELPVADVASALGLAQNTVKTRVHRARLALRKDMLGRSDTVTAPHPIYEKQVCIDLLKTKLEALDQAGPAARFQIPQAEICARCRAVFRELDLVQDACSRLDAGDFPPALRAAVLKAIHQRQEAERSSTVRARRGRKPLASSKSRR